MRSIVASFSPILIFAFVFGCATPSFSQVNGATPKAKEPTAPIIDAQEIWRQLESKCRSNEELFGAFPVIVKEDDNKYSVELIVETRQAESQMETIRSMINGMRTKLPTQIGAVVKLPLQDFVSNLKPLVRERLKRRGCFVVGAYYTSESPGRSIELTLFGSVDENQEQIEREAVLAVAADALRQSPPFVHVQQDSAPLSTPVEFTVVPRDVRGFPLLMPASQSAMVQIRRSLFQDPGLHGTWVDVAECRGRRGELRRYDVWMLLDTDKAEVQRPRVVALLEYWLKPFAIVDEREYPLSFLVKRTRDNLRSQLDRIGCKIGGAYYRRTNAAIDDTAFANKLDVAIFGDVTDVSEKSSIADAANQLMAADRRWRDAEEQRTFRLSADAIRVFSPTSEYMVDLNCVQEALNKEPTLRGALVRLHECKDHYARLQRYDVEVLVDERCIPVAQRREAVPVEPRPISMSCGTRRYSLGPVCTTCVRAVPVPQMHPARAMGPTTCSVKQRAMVTKLLTESLHKPYELFRFETKPFAKILDDISLVIETKRSLSGCSVDDAKFTWEVAADKLALHLDFYGRVAYEEQREELLKIARRYFSKHKSWRSRIADVTINADEIALVATSHVRATEFFSAGLEQYWNGQFVQAEDRFARAIVEAPDDVAYRYWRIMCHIKMGDTDQAYQHMLATVVFDPSSRHRGRIASSLSRVQGKDRQELASLEMRAKSEFYQAFR